MRRIVVHGVHRSGTSLTANLLAKAGFWYAEPQFQMAAQKDNRKGFWERTDVVELNDKILAALKLDWFTLTPGLSNESLVDLNEQFSSEVSDVVERLQTHENWFLKDPRLSTTWAVWEPYLSPTHHIVVNRHPLAVAKSLSRRNGIPIKHGLIFWYHQTRMIASALRNQDNVFTLEYGSVEYGDGSALNTINPLTQDVTGLDALEKSDFDSVFDPGMVTQEELDDEVLGELPSVLEAWEYASNGNYQLVAELPEMQLGDLSWNDVDSKSALTNSLIKHHRDTEGYQREIESYSSKLVAKLRENEALDNQINALSQDILELEERVEELDERREKNEQQIRDQDEQIRDQDKQIHDQNEVVDELNLRLLKISGELKSYMLTKRYQIGALGRKCLSLFGAGRGKNLYDAFDIARFGHAPVDLEKYLPKPSNRMLLLGAILRNPVAFLKRLSPRRVVKGGRMLLGKVEDDVGVDQALVQYASADLASADGLRIYSPEECDKWFDQNIEFVVEPKPTVSIVIPVYNNYLTTLACLHSIERFTSTSGLSFEVLVADDFSSDETVEIEHVVPGIRVVRGESNMGFLQNCNHAIPQANGEYIVLLNNDTNVQENWLVELYNAIEKNDDVGVVGPMFLYPDGRLQEAGGIIFSDASGWNYGRLDTPEKPEYGFTRDVDYVSGACLMFRKSLWNKIGGFDETFTPAYYEDTDFCFEIREKGQKVRYVPTSRVVHFEGVSHGSDEGSGIKKYQALNRQKFVDKWQEVLQKAHYSGPDQLFAARTHGREKGTLLFIDHYVPFHDKDAGSKVAQRYIEILVEEGIHVIFMGDNFYPHQPYTDELQALGVEVLYGEHYKNNWFGWLEKNASNIDSIYLNRPHISEKYIDKIRSLEKPPFIAYHGADLHYIRVGREEELGIANEGGRTADEWKLIEYDLMRKCDVSLWLSDGEVAETTREDPAIRSAYKPMYWFEPEEIGQERNVVSDSNLLFVGGFGHPPNLDGLKWFLSEVFPKVNKAYPDVVLTVIGSNCPPEIQAQQNDNINILGYVTEAELEAAYKNARVSVVPLRYGAGVKGKVIESMKFGVPVMTTSIGAEGLPGKPKTYLTIEDEAIEYATELNLLLEKDSRCLEKIELADNALIKHFSRDAAVNAVNIIMGVTDPAKAE